VKLTSPACPSARSHLGVRTTQKRGLYFEVIRPTVSPALAAVPSVNSIRVARCFVSLLMSAEKRERNTITSINRRLSCVALELNEKRSPDRNCRRLTRCRKRITVVRDMRLRGLVLLEQRRS
jgi:hypothetical protein